MTDTQKQCLLTFLGYDTGGIGNGWGPKSRSATKECQEQLGLHDDGVWGPQTETAVLEAVYTWDDEAPVESEEPIADGALAELFQGIQYWSPEEFRCRCGEYHAPYCDGFPVLPDRTLLEVADDIRKRTGVAHRSSAIRCPQHNADSGGVSNSLHLSGKALDFFVEGYTATRLLAEVQKDSRVRYAYAIDGTYVHMDVN